MYKISILLASFFISTFTMSQDLKPRGSQSVGITDIIIIEAADNGDIWAGSSTSGCAQYKSATDKWTIFNKDSVSTTLQSNTMTGFESFPNNTTVVGTASGVAITGTKPWTNIPALAGKNINGMASRGDSLWVVSSNQVYRYNKNTSNTFVIDATKSVILSSTVTEVENGPLTCNGFWVGTASHGCFFMLKDSISGKIEASPSPKALVSNQVNDIAVDNNCSKIFVATKGGFSICTNDGSTPCVNYTTSNGLPQNDIAKIALGCNGNVWLGTRDSGITVFNTATSQFSRITTNNGLSSNGVSSIAVGADCKTFVGSMKGHITIIDSAKKVIRVMNSIQKIGDISFNLYPNPSSDFITIDFEKNISKADLAIYDIHGRVIKSFNITNTPQFQFSISDMDKGVYFFQLNSADNKEISVGKILVEK